MDTLVSKEELKDFQQVSRSALDGKRGTRNL